MWSELDYSLGRMVSYMGKAGADVAALEAIAATEGFISKDESGVVVGKAENGEMLISKSMDNVLVMGGSNTGKGVNTVIPTALVWKDSAFFLDLKGEIWQLSAGYRKDGLKQKVIRFEPLSEDDSAARWNPLAEIRYGTIWEFDDATRIANLMMGKDLCKEEGTFYRHLASIFLSAIFMLFGNKYKKSGTLLPNMSDVMEFLAPPNERFREILNDILVYELKKSRAEGTMKNVISQFDTIVKGNDESFEAIMKLIRDKLSIYGDKTVQKNLAASDFCIADLYDDNQKFSCYFVSSVKDSLAVSPIAKLFVSMLIDKAYDNSMFSTEMFFSGELDKVVSQRRILFLLNGFSMLGYCSIPLALTNCSKRGVRFCLVDRDEYDIARVYGAKHGLARDYVLQVYFTPTGDMAADTARAISERCGEKVLCDSKYLPQGRKRLNLTPEEILRLGGDDVLLLPVGEAPRIIKKFRYYDDSMFTGRLLVPPESSDLGREIGTFEDVLAVLDGKCGPN